jgi:hypothetical protein
VEVAGSQLRWQKYDQDSKLTKHLKQAKALLRMETNGLFKRKNKAATIKSEKQMLSVK